MSGPSHCDGIQYGKISAQDDRSAHFCTHYKGVGECMVIYCEIKCFDSSCEHVMPSSTFEGGHETSVQVVDLELFISVQVHATSFCTSIQQGSNCPAIDLYGEDCPCVRANGGGVVQEDGIGTKISATILSSL